MVSLSKKTVFLFIFVEILFLNNFFSQGFINYSKKEKDSIYKIDFINKEYKYLDKSFKILTDKIDDREIIYNLSRCENYRDSLRVILRFNLNNSYALHMAYHRILKTWENVGFYIWRDAEQTERLARSFNIYHPHLFYEFLISENRNKIKDKLISNLYNDLCDSIANNIEFENNKQLLYLAFELNPKRIKVRKDYISKHSNHEH
jgi:hypothetical protein